MNVMDPHPLHEYIPHQFTPEQKQFLAAAGWANVEASDLVEIAAAIEAERPPREERIRFLVRELMKRRLFAQRRRALAFAQSYVTLRDAGTDFRLIVWDWE